MNQIGIVAFDPIENTFVNLRVYNDESINIRETMKDVMDPSTISGPLSVQFTLPAERENTLFFRHWEDYRVIGGPNNNQFDARFSVPATITLNGAEHRKGVLSLESVKVHNGTPLYYKVSFGSVLRDIKEIVGDDTLNSLSYLDRYDHEYSADNVRKALNGGINAAGFISSIDQDYHCVYPLISAQSIYTWGSTAGDTDTIMHYPRGSTGNQAIEDEVIGLEYRDFKPAVSIHELFEAIEQKYNFDWDRPFMPLTGAFNKPAHHLFMWCHRSAGRMQSAGGYQEVFINWQHWDYVIASGADHKSAGVTSLNEVTYRITFDIKPIDSGSTSGLTWGYEIYDEITGQVLQTGDNQNGNKTLSITLPSGSIARDWEIGLKLFSSAGLGSFGWSNTIYNGLKTEKLIFGAPDTEGDYTAINPNQSASLEAQYDVFSNVRVRSQLPKMKIIDFLSGIAKMLNLVVYYDQTTGKTIWKEWKDWINDSTTEWNANGQHIKLEHDWTVDRSQLFARMNFKFKAADSFLNVNRNARVDSTDDFGNLSYDVDRASFTGTNEHKVEIPFEKMLFSRFSHTQNGTLKDVTMGMAIDDKYDPVELEPLIFFCDIKNLSTSSYLGFEATYGGADITKVNIPSNECLALGSDGDRQTINFNEEIGEYSLVNEPKSLFKTFWEPWVDQIFNIQSRIIRVKALFSLEFIYNFKMNDTIVTSRGNFRINKIEYDLKTLEGILELTPIVD